MTPLRQQYIDDLKLRNFSAGTIKVYVHAVDQAKFYRETNNRRSQESERVKMQEKTPGS